MPEALAARIETIRKTPFISNAAWHAGNRPTSLKVPRIGEGIRVLFWNIERGLNLDSIKLMFRDPKAFLEKSDVKSAGETADLAEQIEDLRKADILILNELDWGMKRTGYREVVRELGEALGMNWAYAVEFFEIDPVNLGTETFPEGEAEESAKLQEMLRVDKEKFRGIHGTAILSRYPIRSARSDPFEYQAYDWYRSEKAKRSAPEKGKRIVAEKVFLETILREVRRGGRTTLTVTLDVAGSPDGRITVVSPHLENRCKPDKRRRQMREILDRIKDADHTVILAGDLNTSMSDAAPTTIKREIYKRVGSAEFWASRGLKWATGIGLAYDIAVGSVNKIKNLNDPTAKHVPIVAPNPESGFFEVMEKFRFADGGLWDFRGDAARARGKMGTLANSNERGEKGFVATYAVTRTIGPVGQFKLDWIFVKVSPGNGYRMSPHFPRVYKDLNYSYMERVSDHNPISVDLPFGEAALN